MHELLVQNVASAWVVKGVVPPLETIMCAGPTYMSPMLETDACTCTGKLKHEHRS